MTEAEVQAALNTWLAGIAGQSRVINANSDTKRPPKPYLATNLILSGPVHEHQIEDEYEAVGERDNEVVHQAPVRDWFWRFSVWSYGDQPTSLLRKVEVATKIATHTDKLLPLTVFETSGMRNVPEVTENAVEQRANFDIEVRGIVRDSLVVDTIETAPFEAVDTTQS
jgi:hypothetical protein